MRRVPVARVFFSRKARRQIEHMACHEPAAIGWSTTHWSQRSLAQAAVEQRYVAAIHHSTVGSILDEADLHPHRFRFWKTTLWDDEAVARALKILWSYERIASLWQRGEVILGVDEKPNLQVLERHIQPMRAGQIERQEFTYERHGTINVSLTLYTGHMWSEGLPKNDGAHFRPALCRLLHPYSWATRIHLIMDNWSSHISGDTADFLAERSPRVQVLLTPANASWLNQAEALLEAFSERYLLRGSWESRAALIQHLAESRCDYNQRFAHPFAWEWSGRDFLYWLNNTPSLVRCSTY